MSQVVDRVKGWIIMPRATRDGAPLFWFTALVVGALTMIGLVMVLSASSVMSISKYDSAWYVFNRQLVFALAGTVAFYVGARINYHWLVKISSKLLLLTLFLLTIVLIPGIGRSINGSRRWIGINSTFGFQPSEMAKLALLLFCAKTLSRRAGRLHDWRHVMLPLVLILVTMGGLVMLEPDLDTAIEMAIIATGVMWAAGIPKRQLAVLTSIEVAAAAVLALISPYRLGRLLTFMNPDRDALNTSYQIKQSLIALGRGGWTGVGLGNGHAKWLFLPAAHTDFIFAIIGEETGVVGGVIVLALFGAFAFVGCKVSLRAPDREGMLIAAGVTAWVCGQTMINIAMVIGLAPVSGTPLPFISAGGSSLIVLMGAVGVLANVARQCVLTSPAPSMAHPAVRRAHGLRVVPSA